MDSSKYFKLSDSEKRAVLLQMREEYLSRNGANIGEILKAQSAPHQTVGERKFPVTEIQESFYISKYFNRRGDNVGCHIYLEISEPELDVGRLQIAWHQLIHRHEMLNAKIIDGEHQTIVDPPANLAFACHDLRHATSPEINKHFGQCRERLQQKVYAIEDWPLYTIEVTQLPEGETIIHFSIDEWIIDGASLMLLIRQWHQLYKTGNALAITADGADFSAYMQAWQDLDLEEKRTRDLAYWQTRFKDLAPGPSLPVAFSGGTATTFHRKRISRVLSCQDWAILSSFCKDSRVSPTALLLSVFCHVLELSGRSNRFTLLLTLFNRLPLVENVKEIVGPFISTGFYAHASNASHSIATQIKETQEQLWENLDHSSISAISVLRELKNNKHIPPAFSMPVVFTSMLHTGDDAGEKEENWLDSIIYSVTQTPEVYLDHQTFVKDDELHIAWDYAQGYFSDELMLEMMERYLAWLQTLAASMERIDSVTFSDIGSGAPEPRSSQPESPQPKTKVTHLPEQRFEDFPLTEVQQAYFVSQSALLAGEGRSCLIYQELDIEGVSVGRVINAWETLVEYHDALRTIISAEGRQQVRQVQSNVLVRQISLASADEQQKAIARQRIRDEMEKLHFAMDEGPFWDLRISSESRDRHRLHFAIDMLICDANSMQLILKQLITLLENRHPIFSRLRYRDVLLRQQDRNESKKEMDRAYWQDRLHNLFPAPKLPSSLAPPPTGTERARLEAVVENWQGIVAVADRLGIVPSSIVLAVYADVLSAFTGSQPFTLVVVNWNRPDLDPEIDEIAGDFTRLSWLQVPAQRSGFKDFAISVHRQLSDDLAHGDGFSEFRRLAMKDRKANGGHYPIVFTNFMPHGRHNLPANVRLGYGLSQTPGVYLDNISLEINGRLHLHWDARADRIPAAMLQQMFSAYTNILARLASEELVEGSCWYQSDWNHIIGPQLKDIPFIAPSGISALEQQRLWNKTEKDYPLDRCLHEFIEEQVKREPYRIALQFEDRTVSYLDLNQRANRLAHLIRERAGTEPGIVAIVLDRSVEMVVSLLAVLKAGAAYLPIDPEYPPERIAFIVGDANATLVLSRQGFGEKIGNVSATTILIDRDNDVLSRYPTDNPAVSLASESVAYVIYTSGSTGTPKGCLVPHCAIVNRLLWMKDEYRVDQRDRILQKTPYTFDVSVWEFFLPLISGATLVLAKPRGHQDAAYLSQLIQEEKITICHFVPSMLGAFLKEAGVANCRSLSRVFTSGEALPYVLVEKFLGLFDAQLHNLYGPTEAAVDVSYWQCRLNENRQVLIGRPVANTQLYITDEQLNPVAAGEVGELLIGGIQVAKGYLERPELTADKFIRDPFSASPSARLYRTGDYARFLADGNVEYIGRIDSQVKLRGLRIELGEIESCLLAHPQISEVAVRVRNDAGDDPKLVVYVVPRADGSAHPLALKDLRNFLRSSLPDYMLPNAVITLDSLPVTAHGKLDEKALGRLPLVREGDAINVNLPPDGERVTAKREKVESVDSLVAMLKEILKQALSIEQVGSTDDLFDLGVTSLTLVKVAQQVRQSHAVEIPVEVFLDSPNVQAIAEYIYGRMENAGPTTNNSMAASEPEGKSGERAQAQDHSVELESFAFAPEVYSRFRERSRFGGGILSYSDFGGFLSLLAQQQVDGRSRYRYASGGGKNAVQTYVYIRENRIESVPRGFYYYHPSEHALVQLPATLQLNARDFNESYRSAFEQSSFVIFLVAQLSAIEPFYADAAKTLVELDTGYMMQLLAEHATSRHIGLLTVDDVDYASCRAPLQLEDSHEFMGCILGGTLLTTDNAASQSLQISPTKAFVDFSKNLRSLRDIEESNTANRYSTLSKEEREAIAAQSRHLRGDLSNLPRIALPQAGVAPTEYTLRQCIRDYTGDALSFDQLGYLLSLLKKDTGSRLFSSGALPYQVTAYVFIKENAVVAPTGQTLAGLYRYDPERHCLRQINSDVARITEDIKSAHVPFNRTHYQSSGVNIFLLADVENAERQFGNYAIRKAYIEAGRIGQLVMQHQSELDLGVCPIGGMRFDKIENHFNLQNRQLFLHCLLVGAWHHEGRLASPVFGRDEKGLPTGFADGANGEKLSIIGVAGRYPGAETLDDYWRLLHSGESAISKIPSDRWDGERFLSREANDKKSYTQWGGFLENIRRFDSLLFQISPMEARLLDPQERLFMETVWECLENAGYSAESLKRVAPRVGVFVGVMWSDYQSVAMQGWDENNIRQAISFHSSIANRVSHYFDFEGPSLALDTSCSSALSALHLARQSIAAGECDAAIIGGVNLITHPYHQNILCGLGLLSQSESCHAFGENGTGWVVGEGVGAILVRPQSKALACRDHIHVNICGTAVCHSGKTMRYGFPAAEKQARSINACLVGSGVDPADISYIESAATGSGLADAVEADAIKSVFGERQKNAIALGSVKPNIGHLESASFISQLTKVVLQLKNDEIAPSINSEPRNPLINYDGKSFFINTGARSWSEFLRDSGRSKKVALINSFGATGSSGHVIVEAASGVEAMPLSGPVVIPLSAADQEQLRLVVERLRQYLVTKSENLSLADVAFTLQVGRAALRKRAAFIVSSIEELIDQLSGYLAGGTNTLDKQWDSKLQTLAMAWCRGEEVDWLSIHSGRERRIELPTYPFQREEHWLDSSPSVSDVVSAQIGMERGEINNGKSNMQASEKTNNTELLKAVQQYLLATYSRLSGVDATKIEVDASLIDYGINSLLIKSFNVEMDKHYRNVSKTILFECQSISDLATYLLENHFEETARLLNFSGGMAAKTGQSSAGGSVGPERTDGVARQPAETRLQQDIAIIGVAGRYPQADNVEAFWQNLHSGRDCIIEVPADRWDYRKFTPKNRWGGFIDNVDKFDPLFFNISPAEAKLMDPQERQFLEVAWESLEDSGYTRDSLKAKANGQVGVFVGVMYGEYQLFGAEQIAANNLVSVSSCYGSIANRVSYALNLKGPSMAVDTLCSSSLTATHLALQSIRCGDCEMAIVGGVNLSLHPNKYIMHAQMNMPSSTGKCMAFSSGGDGFVPGEGVGAVILKPLDKAIEDGDQVYAIIKGSSVNHDGKTNGYTVPNPVQQGELIDTALTLAQVDPATISYVEAHGTGTSLGDPIEITGLKRAFEKATESKQYCAIGSVKSNIGHLESASGIASMTKVLLQMKHKKLAPSLHADTLNPNIDFEGSPFVVQRQLDDWEPTGSAPRRAAISSFGAGGANAHVILEEFTGVTVDGESEAAPQGEQLFVLSAKNRTRLREYVDRWVDHLARLDDASVDFQRAMYTAQVGREPMQERLAVLARDAGELIAKLKGLNWESDDGNGIYFSDNASAAEFYGKLVGGEESAEILDVLLRHRSLRKLAALWVSGIRIDWGKLYSAPLRKVSIPRYPFARERHWLPVLDRILPQSAANDPVRQLHPLLDENLSDLNAISFRKIFSEASPFVRTSENQEYYSAGPGALVEMLYAAATRVAGGKRLVEINNMNWARPWFENAQPVEVKLEYYAEQDSDTVQALGKYNQQGKPEDIFFAELVFAPADRIALSDNYIDCKKIQLRCPEKVSIPGENTAISDFHYSEAEALVTFTDGSADQSDDNGQEFLVSPRLLEAVFGAVQTFHAKIYPDERATQTVGFRTMRIHCAVAGNFKLHIAQSDDWNLTEEESCYDLSLVDSAGRRAISLEGVLLTPARTASTGISDITSSSMQLSHVCYVENDWAESALKDVDRIEGGTLIFDRDKELALALGKQPMADVVLVTQGKEFKHVGSGNIRHFQMNMDSASHYGKLFKTLLEEKLNISNIIHALSKSRFNTGKSSYRQLSEGVKSLFHIVAHVHKLKAKDKLNVVYLYEADEIQPYYAACTAFLKSWSYENPRVRVKTVVRAPTQAKSEPDIVQVLKNELSVFPPHEYEIRYQATRRVVQGYRPCSTRAQNRNPLLKKGGIYLITGGAGGLGRLFARYLCERYQAKVILLGRRSPGRETDAELARLKHAGGQAVYLSCDVADEKAMQSCRDSILSAFGGLDGIIHAAGLLRDGIVTGKTLDDVETVLAPKVAGSIVLDKVFADQPLQLVVYFSSIVGVLGNFGQCDYAYANAFQDGFAKYRNRLVAAGKRFGRTISINWPLWQNGGMSTDQETEARMEELFGFVSMSSRSGIKAFEDILSSDLEKVTVINGYPEKIARTLGMDEARLISRYDSIRLAQPHFQWQRIGLAEKPSAPDTAAIEMNNAGEDSKQSIAAFLLAQVADATGVAAGQIDKNLEFWELGLDSILSMKIIENIEKCWNIRLYPNEMLEYNNVEKLAGYLASEISTKQMDSVPDRNQQHDDVVEIISAAEQTPISPEKPFNGDGEVPRDAGGLQLADVQMFLRNEVSQATGVAAEEINANLEFWELGLDSILSMKIIENIEHKYGIRLYPNEMLEHNNLEKLSGYLLNEVNSGTTTGKGEVESDSSVVEVITQGSEPTVKAKALPPATEKNKVIFILSTPRSGSTLLRVMLQGHSDIFSPPELHLLPYETLSDWDKRLTELNQRHIREGLIEAVAELEELSAEQAISRVAALQERGFTVRQTYDLLLERAAGRYVVDKSPNHALDLNTLRRAELVCDEPYYIHLIRHPVSVIESFVRNRFDKMFAIKGDPWQYAESLWCDMNRNIQTFLQQVPHARQKFIVYEDLVTRPEEVMTSVCNWLELPYQDSMINPYEGERMTAGLRENSLSIGDPNFNKHKKIESGLAEKWKEHADKIDALGLHTISFAQEFGYFEDRLADPGVKGKRTQKAGSTSEAGAV